MYKAGLILILIPRLREFFRQVQAEVESNSRSKIHQTWERKFTPPLYTHTHGTSTLSRRQVPPTSRILNAQLGYPTLKARILHKWLPESTRKSCNLQLLFAWRILWRESAATAQYCKGQCTNDVCLISRIFDPLSPLARTKSTQPPFLS